MNYFMQQKIAVWFKNVNKAKYVFDVLLESIDKEDIDRCLIGSVQRSNFSITFKNGDSIQFREISEFNGLGIRLTDSFILDDVDIETMNTVIRPATTLGGRGVWKIDSESKEAILNSFRFRRNYFSQSSGWQ